jgi:NADH:ubiquinone oxidoreductase subunit 6 (subunit J)
MMLEVLSAGLLISACLAIFLDEAVYSVAALAGTFLFTALLYVWSGAIFVAIFQFAVGVGSIAVLFLSGEMLSEKPTKKTSLKNTLSVTGMGVLLSLPAIFLSISSPTGGSSDAQFADALWNLRATDIVAQGLVLMTVALGIAIILYDRKNGGK